MRCLNVQLEAFYGSYALIVYRHAWLFIIGPLAATACFGVGVFLAGDRMIIDNKYLFTPHNGQNRHEKASILKHWPYDEENFVAGMSVNARHWLYVVITPKNDTTGLWTNETLDEIIKLNDHLMTNYTLTASSPDRSSFTYSDICLSYREYCFSNGHVIAMRAQNIIVDVGGGPKAQYPISREYLTHDATYFAYLLGNVKLNSTDNTIIDFGAIRLVYLTKTYPSQTDSMSIQWRNAVQDYLLNHYRSDLIHLAMSHELTVDQGLWANATYYAPQVAVTVVLMLLFSFINSFVLMQRPKFVRVDWVRSKPLLAAFGVIEPALAIISCVGFMQFVGLPLHPVLVIMPFLVFAIGIDDMFIMISAWHNTKRTDPPELRFSHALSEAAVSVTITSVSDVVAFAVGTWNSLPGVQIFCAYTSVAFFFELIYQCTFYAAALALFAKAECQGRHCFSLRKAIRLEDATTCAQRRFSAGTIVTDHSKSWRSNQSTTVPSSVGKFDDSGEQQLNFVQKLFHEYYVPALLRPTAKILAVVLFVAYLSFAGWGCAVMGNGLRPEKVMLTGHYSGEFLKTNHIWQNGTPIEIVVGKPTNVSTREGRAQMLELTSAFENTSHSMDENGTFHWLREYTRYLNSNLEVPIENTREQWCEGVKAWQDMDSRGYWVHSIRWGNESQGEDPCRIVAFRFLITATSFGVAEEIMNAAILFRQIADNYSRYEVSTYNEYFYPYADQYIMITPTMIRNGIIAVIAMIAITMLMIPHPVCGVFITLSIVSIDTGVTGFLAWWGVNMDCLSMMAMIMATGFAIDLSAHVSYAYLRSHGTPEERVTRALKELGWPVFQGVTSTLLGVLILGLIDSYMYNVFFKTVFLVIVFGTMHSLFLLPIALIVFVPSTEKPKSTVHPEINTGKLEADRKNGSI